MVDRCDENSKIIVVDGPIAAGKSEVAAKLAEEFEMVYVPPPSFDDYYINPYGYDLRTLDDRLSPGAQSCDIQKFLTNPHHVNVPMFQLNFLQFRYDQYITVVLHLLSTGQGVVLNRSFYSDVVFAKAMANAGYLRPQALKFYQETARFTHLEMMRPHLIVYLDVPVDTVKERIKKRGIPYEVNSKVLTTDYLQDIENTYKQDYLKNAATHSHVLIYDWTKKGDISTMVEDIEMLNFDYDKKEKKMRDWTFENVQELRRKRWLCINRDFLHVDYMRYDLSCPEMHYTPEEDKEIEDIMRIVPGEKYLKGFNPDQGDKVLWKVWDEPPLGGTLIPYSRDLDILKNEVEKLKASATL
ncbi:NADH dehydrogenase [ubiquinone] 1 alpha subcomplex subunit 10, mitochondrial isoform X2 [Pseudomyrmex gracilis]|nr:NADH dehydrogenase [ubiquinone] 1 alpha subcomplex subunit 10, mitochondrial isoform X2 [Pseudomyrmex gracilis]